MTQSGKAAREAALGRARDHSPFLREAALAYPDIADTFAKRGSEAAAAHALSLEAETVESELRRRRTALALAVALGDLAG